MSVAPAAGTEGSAHWSPPLLRMLGVAALTLLAVILVVSGWHSRLRAFSVLLFFLFCPGLAIAELLRLRDGVEQIAMAVGVSLGLETIVSIVLLYAGAFTANLAFGIMAGVTVAAMAAVVVRERRPAARRPPDEP
jgi:uncharacterized membrane protein